jgi:arsenite methyltransferase
MKPDSSDEIRNEVRIHYAAVARTAAGCCSRGCCAPNDPAATTAEAAVRLGYSSEDVAAAPEGANMGLGCGNPQAIAALAPGETVIDLGSGAGFDCFLAARQVAPGGKVIGVDMTPDMISRARRNAARTSLTNVEFRLGEIEHLPVPDGIADVVISNCVINLSPDKPAVFRDAFRVLRPGGRLAISDILALKPLPEVVRRDLGLYCGCVAGAASIGETERLIREAGFVDVQVTIDPAGTAALDEMMPGHDLRTLVAAARIEARRPE